MEVLILCGLPGSGKSTFCLKRLWDTHIRLSMDMLKTRYREKLLFNALIESKQRFVVDNTNPTTEDRARYIVPAKAAGFRVAIYHFDVPFCLAAARNARRQGKACVPEKGMNAIHKAFKAPSWAEGADALYRVLSEDGFQFHIEKLNHDEL